MPNSSANPILNHVLITLNRGLLQYLGECSPWTAANEKSRQEKVTELIAVQKAEIERLVTLLTARRAYIDFGLYPTEYTDLQFLALDFLLDETLENSQAGLSIITEAITATADDTAAQETLKHIQTSQQQIVSELEKLLAVNK